MQNIRVGCIPVRQTIEIDNKTKVINFIKRNKIGLIVSAISTILLTSYLVLFINFINLIKILN